MATSSEAEPFEARLRRAPQGEDRRQALACAGAALSVMTDPKGD
jgi:hypothetical protein